METSDKLVYDASKLAGYLRTRTPNERKALEAILEQGVSINQAAGFTSIPVLVILRHLNYLQKTKIISLE